MKFDLLYLPTYWPELDGDYATLYGRMLEQIERADELGFASVWLTEHHLNRYGGALPNPAVFGAAIACRTRRIRIGTAVTVLPMHHPLLVAEDFAMLDVLSGGRLEFGIGKGSVQAEFTELGIDAGDTARTLDQASTAILAAWCEEGVLPLPVQRPHPPVWVGATRTPETFAWAGRRGYHLMVLPYMMPPEALNERLALYWQAAREAGHDLARLEIMGKFHVYVAESAEETRRLAAPAYDRYQQLTRSRTGRTNTGNARASWEQDVAEYKVIGGTPDDCLERLRYWQRTVGLTHLGGLFHFGGLDQAATLRSIELFAREIAAAPALVG